MRSYLTIAMRIEQPFIFSQIHLEGMLEMYAWVVMKVFIKNLLIS